MNNHHTLALRLHGSPHPQLFLALQTNTFVKELEIEIPHVFNDDDIVQELGNWIPSFFLHKTDLIILCFCDCEFWTSKDEILSVL
jgi:hypothetical protein